MTESSIYDFLKTYVDKQTQLARDDLQTMFTNYKTKEIGTNIDSVKTVANNMDTINNNVDYIKKAADNINDIQEVNHFFEVSEGISTGNQLLGSGLLKGIQYLYNKTTEDTVITIPSDCNAFSIENLTLGNGSSLVIEDGATYKII